jgi:hypothetical protein
MPPTSRHDPPPPGAHSVSGAFGSMTDARRVIEDLEEAGVPPEAISLTEGVDEEAGGYDSERRFLGDVTRATVAGATAGAIVGAILGALVTLAFPDAGLALAAVLGAIFGAGVGGTAGGLSATKYNSPAWTETYEAAAEDEVTVEVAHADADVVEKAREIIESGSG